jgi:hypothetical protein
MFLQVVLLALNRGQKEILLRPLVSPAATSAFIANEQVYSPSET